MSEISLRTPSLNLEKIRTGTQEQAKKEILHRILFRLDGTEKNRAGEIPTPRMETLNLCALFLLYRWDPVPDLFPADLAQEDFVPLSMGDAERAGLSIPELFRQSLKNMTRRLPPRGENLARLVGGREDPGLTDMLVLTNRANFYGAAVVFYPGLLKSLAKCEGSGFYLIPSSIHEMILFPEKALAASVAEVNQMIHDINLADVREEEVLSETLYHYLPETDEIVIA